MRDHIKFRLFLVVMFALIGAFVFLSDPFANNNISSGANEAGNTVNSATDENVMIEDEEVAMGVPGVSNTNSRWVFIAIAVTVVNLAGAIGIVFLTSRETSQI